MSILLLLVVSFTHAQKLYRLRRTWVLNTSHLRVSPTYIVSIGKLRIKRDGAVLVGRSATARPNTRKTGLPTTIGEEGRFHV